MIRFPLNDDGIITRPTEGEGDLSLQNRIQNRFPV